MLKKLGLRYANRYFLFFLAIISVNLIAFQNCGKAPRGQRDYSSLTGGLDPASHKEKQIIVRMKDTAANASLSEFAAANGLKLENNWPDSLMSHWSWEGKYSVQEFQAVLAESSMKADIVYAEPNYYFYEAINYSLNEILSFPLAAQTLTSVNIQQSDLWSGLTPGKAKPIIAVIDTGINTAHDVFTASSALWVNAGETPGDGIDNDGNGYIDDVNGFNFRDRNSNITDLGGHGTHVAGIILGVGQNIFKPTANIDQANIKIMTLKFIGPEGSGTTSDAINAIIYAVKNGARVISNSWGGSSQSNALEDAIAIAYDKEVVFVAAAGNTASNIDSAPVYPASIRIPNVISVAATNASDRLANFSNYGLDSVSLGAPGERILSTYPNNLFTYLSGTSMATPFVAGTAILQIYERPELLSYQLKNIILKKSNPASALVGKIENAVRLNANASVQEAKVAVLSTEHPAYKADQSTASEEQSKKAGCGTITKIASQNPPTKPPLVLICLLFMPLALAFKLRLRTVR